MPKRREILSLLGVGAVAGVAGWWAFSSKGGPTPPSDSTPLVDLQGRQRSLKEWDGRVRVLNFWATWCAPCKEEIPALVLSREKFVASGVEFIGIAVDHASKVAEFVRSVPISYPVLIGGASSLSLVREWGNPSGGLPFTVVFNSRGEIVHRNLGPVTQQTIENQVRAVLAGSKVV